MYRYVMTKSTDVQVCYDQKYICTGMLGLKVQINRYVTTQSTDVQVCYD